MTTFHTLDEAEKEFNGMWPEHADFFTKKHVKEAKKIFSDFFPLVWQAAQEARNRELVEKVEKLFKDCDDREDRVEITDVLSLINK